MSRLLGIIFICKTVKIKFTTLFTRSVSKVHLYVFHLNNLNRAHREQKKKFILKRKIILLFIVYIYL